MTRTLDVTVCVVMLDDVQRVARLRTAAPGRTLGTWQRATSPTPRSAGSPITAPARALVRRAPSGPAIEPTPGGHCRWPLRAPASWRAWLVARTKGGVRRGHDA